MEEPKVIDMNYHDGELVVCLSGMNEIMAYFLKSFIDSGATNFLTSTFKGKGHNWEVTVRDCNKDLTPEMKLAKQEAELVKAKDLIKRMNNQLHEAWSCSEDGSRYERLLEDLMKEATALTKEG